jgi:type I restriction enzyme S subunit
MSKRGLLSDNVTSATIAYLTGEKLSRLKIPLPPLALQQQFAAQITQLETIKARARASLAEMDALFASLQSRAFSGELSDAA